MRLYWAPKTRALRATWMLAEAGVAYERIRIDVHDAAAKADPAFRRVSPLGKVPALEDGPARLWDSGAICAYIADRHPERHLAPPPDSAARGAYLQWLVFTNSVLEPAMFERRTASTPNPSQHGWGDFDGMLGVLRAQLAPGGWILGDRFSAADVMLGTSCLFLYRYGIIEGEQVLQAYVDRCTARPAFREAAALDEAAQGVHP